MSVRRAAAGDRAGLWLAGGTPPCAELDLVVHAADGTREGCETILGTAPQPPRGFWNVVDDLTLDSVIGVHAGEGSSLLRADAEARALVNLASA